MIAILDRRVVLSGIIILAVTVAPRSASAMNDPVAGRWLQRDPIGRIEGANLYQFIASNPIIFQDPKGLFKIGEFGFPPIHEEITRTGLWSPPYWIKSEAESLIVDAVKSNDMRHFFEEYYHAQNTIWFWLAHDNMRAIETIHCTPYVGTDRVLHLMGETLHILQDFYSHTDWLEGVAMRPVYRHHQDYLLAVRSISHPTRSPNQTLSLNLLASSAVESLEQYGDIIMYEGGEGFGDDHHNLYAVDKPDFGRGQSSPDGLGQTAFLRAKQAAIKQTTEFKRWAAEHMRCSCYKEIFEHDPPYANNRCCSN